MPNCLESIGGVVLSKFFVPYFLAPFNNKINLVRGMKEEMLDKFQLKGIHRENA